MQDNAELRARIEAQVAARRAKASPHPPDDADDEPDASPRPRPSTVVDPRTLSPTRAWPAREPAGSDDAVETEPAAANRLATDDEAGLEPVRPWMERPSSAAGDGAGPVPSNPATVLSRLSDGIESDTPHTDPEPSLADRLEEHRRFAQRHAAADAAFAAGVLPADAPPEQGAPIGDPGSGAATGAGSEPNRRHRWRRRRTVDPATAADDAPRHAAEPGAPALAEPAIETPMTPNVEPDTAAAAAVAEPDTAAAAAEPDTSVAAAAAETGLPDVDADAGDPAPEVEYPWLRKEEVDLDLKGAPTWDPAEYPAEAGHGGARGARAGRAFKWLFARAEPAESPGQAPADQAVEAPPELSVEALPELSVEALPEPSVEALEPGHHAPLSPNAGWVAAEFVTTVVPEPETGPELIPEPHMPDEDDQPPSERRRGLAARLRRRSRDDDADDESIEPFTLPEPDAAFATPWTVTLRRPDPEPAPERAPLAIDDETEPLAPPPPPEPLRPPEPLQPPEPLRPPDPPAPPEPPRPPEPPHVPEPPYVPEPLRPRPGPRHAPATTSTGTGTPMPPSTASWPPPLDPPAPLPPRLGIADDPGATPDWLGGGISGVSFAKPGSSTKATPSPDLTRFLAASEQRPGDDERPVIAAEDEQPARTWRNWRGWRFVVRTTIILAIAAVAALLLREFVVAPYYIPSESMEPTLHGCANCTDDRILVDKISYRTHDPKEGDIVVFNRPDHWRVPDNVVVKRVIGLPGDVLSLKNGRVFVNGLLLDESYVNKACKQGTEPLANKSKWTVPDNDVFVMGDNRCNSEDSRAFGPIPQSDIIGRAFMIIWPVDRIRFL